MPRAVMDLDDIAALNLAEVQPLFPRPGHLDDLLAAPLATPQPSVDQLAAMVEAASLSESGSLGPPPRRACSRPSLSSRQSSARSARSARRAATSASAWLPDPAPAYAAVDKNMLSFSVYPTSQEDLQANVFLWQIARRADYDIDLVEHQTGIPNCYAIVIPRTLYHFLRSVSLPEMYHCILSLLAEVAVDDEGYGIAVMESELEPSVFADLKRLLEQGPTPGNALTQVADKVSPIIDELLLQMSGLEPWKIHAQLMYVDPVGPEPILALADPALLDPRVYHKLFCQWRAYRLAVSPVLVSTSVSLPHVLDQFVQIVYAGRQQHVADCAAIVILASTSPASPLHSIPNDLITQILIPYVFLYSFATPVDLSRPPISQYRYRFPSTKRTSLD